MFQRTIRAAQMFVALISFPTTLYAQSIEEFSACVDNNGFHFNSRVTGDGAEIIFRIGADTQPFTTPNERIAVNFDSASGAITRLEPTVQTFGAPEAGDRWVDGVIQNFDIVNDGGFSWHVSGTVPHGTTRFNAGDTLWGLMLRPGSAYSGPVVIDACQTGIVQISVPFQTSPPRINGKLDFGEWGNRLFTPQVQLENGVLTVFHDSVRLYFLFNMRGDTTPDREGDQLWMLFDVDRDGFVTPGVDRRYRMESGTRNFRYETYATSGTFNTPAKTTFSSLGEGYGCFFGDGSARLYPTFRCDEHRVWEVAIDLREIQAIQNGEARLGILVASNPGEFETLPSDLNDLSQFIQLTLTGSTDIGGEDGETSLDLREFRVSQAIQDATNSEKLVKDRKAWIDLLMENETIPGVIANVYASRNGVDMAGSPLAVLPNFQRDPATGVVSARELVALPDSWTADDIDVRTIFRQPNIGAATPTNISTIDFVPSETPTYWIVPFNTGTAAAPVRASENYILRNELETIATFPVEDIDFVRRPEVIDNPATSQDAIDELNAYDQTAVLAWVLGVLLTGESPFTLPDQVVGVFPQRQYGFIGLSDPLWLSGAGRVTWVQDTALTNLNIPHEINHNLDTDVNGTWGRHVPVACRTVGPDSQWPHTNDDIQEPGLVGVQVLNWSPTLLNPPLAVDATTPDYMSYCTTNVQPYPSQWVSPYRWRNQLQNVFEQPEQAAFRAFSNTAADQATQIQDGLYVTGRIVDDGSGELDPVIRQPGIIRTNQGEGDYELRLLACDGSVPFSKSFSARFVDVEGRPRKTSSFAMIVPDATSLCSVQLLGFGNVLDERTVSANAPVVSVLAPAGGDEWSGNEAVRWLATDDDGDTLSATVLFSGDAGATWRPVANGVSGEEILIDSNTLPGTDSGLIRLVVSDGVNTTIADSTGLFSVVPKAPTVTIISPVNNAIVPAGTLIEFNGIARDPQGERLDTNDFVWIVDGFGMAIGHPATAILEPGSHTVTLEKTGSNGLTGSDSIVLTVLDVGEPSDAIGDVGLPDLDIVTVDVSNDGGRFVCSITIASGGSALSNKNQYKCEIDFDDEESEIESHCDANQDSEFSGGYRLGNNADCSTTDTSLVYRVLGNGGRCTGPGDVACATLEYDTDGNSDTVCDGIVDGAPGQYCLINLSTDLVSLAMERSDKCGPDSGCPVAGDSYPVNLFVTAHSAGERDRLPNTGGRDEPDEIDEALQVRISNPQ